MSPFVVFGLPRSRTAWLAHWLGCGHDLAPQCDTVQGFLDRVWTLPGAVETGAARAWRLIRLAEPRATFVTIRRPRADVVASLARFGIVGLEDELARRDADLDEVEAAGATRIDYAALDDARVCAWLWEKLTGTRFDFDRWRQFDLQNIQVDMPAWLAMLRERAPQIERLKTEADELTARIGTAAEPQFVRIGIEPVVPFWADAQPLAEAHHREVNAGDTPRRPFIFDLPVLDAMEKAGAFRVYTARVNGTLAGYCTWSIGPDVECASTTIADQGGWFVDDRFRNLHLGKRMLERSLCDLKAAGVNRVQLHHQLSGRGSRAGVMFRRMGAVPLQHRYTMELA